MFHRCYFRSFLNVALSLDNGWTDRNAGCCVNTVDEKVSPATNLVNLGSATHEILWLFCMGGECR